MADEWPATFLCELPPRPMPRRCQGRVGNGQQPRHDFPPLPGTGHTTGSDGVVEHFSGAGSQRNTDEQSPRRSVDLQGLEGSTALLVLDRFDFDVLHVNAIRSEEHTSELQSRLHLVCRLLLEKKNREGGWRG